MNIKESVKGIIKKIAVKLGLKVSDTEDSSLSFADKGFNPLAIGAAVVANIAVDDSDIIIEGESKRAKAIRKIKDYYQEDMETAAAEIALATGGCIIRPFSDGVDIGVNLIGNDNFMITDAIGRNIKGVIMQLDWYVAESDSFKLFESQRIISGVSGKIVEIKRFAFKNGNETDILRTRWKEFKTEEYILSDQLLFGFYRCPTLNRDNYNSSNGVPITFGNEKVVENVKKKYEQYNEEFNRKEAVIFADRTLFRKEDGSSQGKKEYSLAGKTFIVGKPDPNGAIESSIKEYSPEINEEEWKAGINLNLSVLEMCCGFSRGVFTAPETAFATATEMHNSLKKTFSFVKRFRSSIAHGNKMLFNAISIIMTLNGTVPYGDFKVSHDWSYDYIEQTTEKFNQLLQAHAAGCLKDEDLVSWVKGIDEQEAQKYMQELRAYAEDDMTDEQPFKRELD